MSDTEKKPNRQQVYTLLVEIGRKSGDGLPAKATGAALMVYASGVDEAEAVRETVAILKQADCAPLDVSGYGTLAEREAEGHDISDEERAVMPEGSGSIYWGAIGQKPVSGARRCRKWNKIPFYIARLKRMYARVERYVGLPIS